MTQKVTCKKFRPSAMWRLVIGLEIGNVSKKCCVSNFDGQSEKKPHPFSRFKWSKNHLLFKLKALLSLKRQKQLTRIYCVTFQEN